jgi:hypothetical protein
MRCRVCERQEENHAPGCPHDKAEESFERKEYARGLVDGRIMRALKEPNDYYILGYQNGAGVI